MASTFKDLIQSHQFTFFIGDEEKPIVVHAAAIAATSPQLDALINGGMVESEKQCARIKDVEVDDFIRFCEYAYRGDYTVPPCEETPPSPSDTVSKNGDIALEGGFGSSLDKKKKKKKAGAAEDPPAMVTEYTQEKSLFATQAYGQPRSLFGQAFPSSRAQLRAEFIDRKYLCDSDPKALILQRFEPGPNSIASQNFTPVLLAHARLYCFAHVRFIAPLKKLTLDKLHKTLLRFKLYKERVGDIIELVRYVYTNPDLPGRGEDAELDALRKLILDYIICEIDTIGQCDGFVSFMEEGGEFVGDFWRMAKKYMP